MPAVSSFLMSFLSMPRRSIVSFQTVEFVAGKDGEREFPYRSVDISQGYGCCWRRSDRRHSGSADCRARPRYFPDRQRNGYSRREPGSSARHSARRSTHPREKSGGRFRRQAVPAISGQYRRESQSGSALSSQPFNMAFNNRPSFSNGRRAVSVIVVKEMSPGLASSANTAWPSPYANDLPRRWRK